ncbi:DUF763 domain-containing protein [Treponema zioleckii]|uniref:DUF763 domain-containing protein n=1 Tax=Treponema zioleckii TaxID=331680 RepID=UPI00168B8230|nr:DUF763 domain-containing protein [Treponema zioleckii]
MIKRSGYADLPLHYGTVPKWLADRMMILGTEIIEALLINYGKKEVLTRLSDPLWFQSLGAVLGMDWHSSGITTSVMYALKRGINKRAHEFGLCICGGRGKYSRKTPEELLYLADATGLNGTELVKASRLSAKVDSTAVQDGFQLYMHNFILSDEGDWAVVQQGMNPLTKTARRYHWSSENVKSFVEEPHSAVTGENQGRILNLTDSGASQTRSSILTLSHENPDRMIKEIAKISGKDFSRQLEFNFDDENLLTSHEKEPAHQHSEFTRSQTELSSESQKSILLKNDRNLVMPSRHEVQAEDVDLKRLGAVLATAYENDTKDFESLLLTPGLGARTLQSLTLVSEVIYGTPSRFSDPARFSFAHGGKDGHPFPVPCKIYDESIRILGESIEKSKLGYNDKSECLKRLNKTALQIEQNCDPLADFDATLAHERQNSHNWGGRTCLGFS